MADLPILPTVHKAHAYVTRGLEILVFTEPSIDPSLGPQVPGGTVESDETPGQAVVRELFEETGIRRDSFDRHLGSYSYRIQRKRWEIERRHVYHFDCSELGLADNWVHVEEFAGSGIGPIPLHFEWLSLDDAEARLLIGHGTLIPALGSLLAEA